MSLKNTGAPPEFSIRTNYTENLDDMTAAIWFYATNVANSPFVMHKWNIATSDGFGAYRSGTGTDFRVNCSHLSGTPNSCTQAQAASLTTWHLQIVRRISGTVDNILDNTKVTNATGTAGLMGTHDFYIANSIGGLNGFTGNLVSCAVWNVGINDSEATSIFRGFSPMKVRPQSLKVYARMLDKPLLCYGSVATQDVPAYLTDATLMPRLYSYI